MHVRDIGMKSVADPAIANYALAHGLTIVSKDADFLALRFVLSGEHIRPEVIGAQPE
jgi:predicted nuclease of predicted toxin-antitoxin system